MTLHRRRREEMLALCSEIHEDDGVDPRTYFSKKREGKTNDRKARQLCHQVAEALCHVLAGETGDDGLRELHLASVEPSPDSSCLLVTLHPSGFCDMRELESLARRIDDRAGRLRCEVAAAITRRKTPMLTFRVLPRVSFNDPFPGSGEVE
ncbi:MAG: ribosome-binding factor A [Planctomycetota bacterium]